MDIAPILDVELADLPAAIEDLVNEALNGTAPADHVARKIGFIHGDILDLVQIGKNYKTMPLLVLDETNLVEIKNMMVDLCEEVRRAADRRVHDSAVTPTGAVRSPARLTLVGG